MLSVVCCYWLLFVVCCVSYVGVVCCVLFVVVVGVVVGSCSVLRSVVVCWWLF